MNKLSIYNSLTRKKEVFEPINPPFAGMYVCGPTVYGDAHLGHARPVVCFDVIYRYLMFCGYKVRYVRNITDVGHLENDADEGEDKIAKKAKLEKVEPMEIAQHFTNSYHEDVTLLNVLNPSIEPRASGHIPEQIKMIKEIIDNGYAYVVNGSVYLDVEKYNKKNNYGKLSGRVLEELMAGTRELESQGEKKNSFDFALWKKADVNHIMRWDSPWGDGFPGWHLECSAMGAKYLGTPFDIHGGGMDLLFPHHECEIAQGRASKNTDPVKYWVHNNLVTINGQKMGKSLNNFITLKQLFSGNHHLLEKPYSPMTIRFFILQAHYRSTLDFSNEALKAAEKGHIKIINGLRTIKSLKYHEDKSKYDAKLNTEIAEACNACKSGMDDDFNTAITLANLFAVLKYINSIKANILNISALSQDSFDKIKNTYINYIENILGLCEQDYTPNQHNLKSDLINIILDSYAQAKANKDYSTVDKIRAELKKHGIVIKDMKTGYEWAYEE